MSRTAHGGQMGRFDEARTALQAGDDARALEALIEEWAEHRAPRLAELVTLLDARMRR